MNDRTDRGLSRREVLATGAALSAGAAASRAWGFAVGNSGAVVVQSRASEAWRPLFFDRDQVSQVAAVCEELLPGSTEARVVEFLDLELSLDSRLRQDRFVEGLASLEALCRELNRKKLRTATPQQIRSVLQLVSDDREDRKTGVAESFFDDLKRRTIFAYYTSIEGRRALGLGDTVRKQVFEGCQHKDAHG